MQELDLGISIFVVLVAVGSALLALLLLSRFAPANRTSWAPVDPSDDAVAFLLKKDDIVDATPAGLHLLENGPRQMRDWPKLKAVLSFRFPGIVTALADLGTRQHVEIGARDGSARLSAERCADMTRIVVRDTSDFQDSGAFTGSTPFDEEVSELRKTLDGAPLLIWKEDAAGTVRWANSAYIERALATNPESETLSWPLPQLFEDAPWRYNASGKSGGPTFELKLPAPPESADHRVTSDNFVVHRKTAGDAIFLYAVPSDDLVNARAQLQEFVQTLTKTFAHLPIGLAVFDKDRRLAMFNPALTDLTKLPPLFLSRRPTLFDFLDQLREARRMPEPKNYREWRRKISELEHASSNGVHIESWSLPDGTTLRVTGRPHPNGAIAFLLQDITSEVSLTHRFRLELELGQAVVDGLPEAIAVFSATRDLVLTNAAYDAMWLGEATNSIRAVSLREALEAWERDCAPSPFWAELRKLSLAEADGSGWQGEIRRSNGHGLFARVKPLPGNALLVGFSDARVPFPHAGNTGGSADAPSDADRPAQTLEPRSATAP